MLFEPFQLRTMQIANRLVMSPLTRSRAVHDNTANALMATYYAQRATAGLIITEGTSPSPNGLGYARIPGLFQSTHVSGWKLVTDAVHARGGRIVVQLMHTGRVSHQANLPAGAEVLGPSPEICPGEMWTDAQGSQPHTAPRAMTASRRPAARCPCRCQRASSWCSTCASAPARRCSPTCCAAAPRVDGSSGYSRS